MIRVVGVRFKKAGKIYYFDPGDLPVMVGCAVIVETARGIEYGEVAVGPRYVSEEEVVQPLKPVIRTGTPEDAEQVRANKARERHAFEVGLKKIEAHGLPMRLVDVEYTFDGSKIIFSFTADGRVDFRELVRDLAGVFRTRIEMRQIGVRDEAKLIGGLGPCGRILCCTSFLGEFAPVSIRMAKDQNLSLNPSKISGVCGRLMCCLRYEQETYEAAKEDPTLAPGYVPPVLTPDVGADEVEEEPDVVGPSLKPAAALGTPDAVGGRLGRAVAERSAAGAAGAAGAALADPEPAADAESEEEPVSEEQSGSRSSGRGPRDNQPRDERAAESGGQGQRKSRRRKRKKGTAGGTARAQRSAGAREDQRRPVSDAQSTEAGSGRGRRSYRSGSSVQPVVRDETSAAREKETVENPPAAGRPVPGKRTRGRRRPGGARSGTRARTGGAPGSQSPSDESQKQQGGSRGHAAREPGAWEQGAAGEATAGAGKKGRNRSRRRRPRRPQTDGSGPTRGNAEGSRD